MQTHIGALAPTDLRGRMAQGQPRGVARRARGDRCYPSTLPVSRLRMALAVHDLEGRNPDAAAVEQGVLSSS